MRMLIGWRAVELSSSETSTRQLRESRKRNLDGTLGSWEKKEKQVLALALIPW